jgi:post-segregation antitoxin (ccd killing protein)
VKRYATEKDFTFCGSAMSLRNVVKRGPVVVTNNSIENERPYQINVSRNIKRNMSAKSIKKEPVDTVPV